MHRFLLVICGAILAGCAAVQSPAPISDRADAPGMLPALTYYQTLARLGPAEQTRERNQLARLAPTPGVQLRQAMLLGHPRLAGDTARALALLDGLLRSVDPAAAELQPLARLLADQYSERLRLEAQNERQAAQLKESQRKSQELQEKLDSLADIERTLTPPPRSLKGGRQ